MKRQLIGLALLAATTMGWADNGVLYISGKMAGIGDTVAVFNASDREKYDKVAVKDGQFEVDHALDRVETVYVVGIGALRGERDAARLSIIGVPGERVELTGSVNDRYDITGSTFYQQYHEADLAMEAVQNEEQAIMEQAQKLMEEQGQQAAMAYYQEQVGILQKKMEQTLLGFIREHADWDASAALVGELSSIAPEKMSDAVTMLSDGVRNGRMKLYYEGVIAAYEAEKKAQEELAAKQAAGREAPDFTLNDLEGRPLALSSLRGKYVVLDFWGSWCGWCIKGFPEMKTYYEKYSGKFEILGIDCNDTEEKWKDAVKKYELPWLHVYNPRTNRGLMDDYGITGFPTKIVVGPDGKIVKAIVGESPAFYTLLDELFGK